MIWLSREDEFTISTLSLPSPLFLSVSPSLSLSLSLSVSLSFSLSLSLPLLFLSLPLTWYGTFRYLKHSQARRSHQVLSIDFVEKHDGQNLVRSTRCLSLSQKARSVDHTKFHRSPELGASFCQFLLSHSLSLSLCLLSLSLFPSSLRVSSFKVYGKAE